MLNKVTLIGTVANEPRTNSAATFFTVATWNHWKGKKYTTRTKVDVFGVLRQDLPSMSEGDLILVEGKLNNKSYEKNGQTVWATSVVASIVELVTSSGMADAHTTGGVLHEDAKEPSNYPPKQESEDNGDGDFPW